MSDIVERLRESIISAAISEGLLESGLLGERLINERREAADEIDRLRAALRVIADSHWVGCNPKLMVDTAKEALGDD